MKSMIKVREDCKSEEGQEFIAIKVSDLYSYTPPPPQVSLGNSITGGR